MNPPLRSDADVAALTAAIADGTIDAIATDHAPHAPETKERPFEEAPPGMLGVETALAVAITKLVDTGVMTLAQVIGALSWRPARIAGLDAAGHGLPIAAGNPANLCVLDPAEQWVVDPDRLASRSRNTPFAGWKLSGRVRHTVLRGQPTVLDHEAQAMSVDTEAVLILRDGEIFEGEAIGALDAGSVATGEVVFNTALSGYQEIVTDPSYAGQIITFTYPHIGNYGTNPDDDESRRPFCRGVVVRDLARRPSSWRSTEPFPDFLARHGVPGIAGIDTRRLTRHLRDAGAVPGAFGTDEALVRAAAAEAAPTDGIDLAATVTTDAAYTVGDPDAPFHVVAYDLGIKRTILRHLKGAGCFVEVVPAATPAAEVLEPQARRRLPLERSRRPGRGHADDRRGARPGGHRRPGVRHLPRPPDPRARARRADGEAPVRSPRRQPSGPPRVHRPGRDHQPEPQLRGRRRRARRRRRDHARQPQRRGVRGPDACAASRSSRCSTIPRPDPGRTTPRTCSRSSPH